MPPRKGKGRGKRTIAEPESPVGDAAENLLALDPNTDLSGETAEQQDTCEDLESLDEDTDSSRRKIPEMAPAVEQALCDWFADHPLFYDLSDASFKNRQRKDRLLEQKSKELNMTGDQLAMWWKSQRTMYGRLHKKKSGQAASRMTERQKWNLRNFSFLKSHISVRTVTKQLGKVPCQEPEEGDEGLTSEVDGAFPSTTADADQQRSSSQATLSVPKRKRQQTAAVDDALLKLVEQASGTQQLCQQVDELLHSSRSPRTVFSQWIAAETEYLPDDLFRRFQADVFSTVMRYRDIAAHQSQMPQAMNTSPVMPQYTSVQASFPMLHRTAANQNPASVGLQMPTQVSARDVSQAPTYQQHLQGENFSGLSVPECFPLPTSGTCIATATVTDSPAPDTGAQVVMSEQILQGGSN